MAPAVSHTAAPSSVARLPVHGVVKLGQSIKCQPRYPTQVYVMQVLPDMQSVERMQTMCIAWSFCAEICKVCLAELVGPS